MSEEQSTVLDQEISDIIRSRFQFIQRHYLAIREAYKNPYEWPELDPLRHEISLCIMFGFCQAAITLTNHFLETLLKYALIIHHGRDKETKEDQEKRGVVSSLVEQYEEARNKYGNLNLDTTINCTCTVGLIGKEQKKQLHEFRERFRNAYGHSDKAKTFAESTIPATGLKFNGDKVRVEERSEPKIAELLVGQGLVQAMVAQEDAPRYFLYIDLLARQIADKLFGPKAEKE